MAKQSAPPQRVQRLNVDVFPKMNALFLSALFWLSILLPAKMAAQPTCGFSVLADGTGIATVNLTPPLNGCPNVIDWGDGCTNNNTNSLVRHRYSSCGTFTITHTVRWNSCIEFAVCTQQVTINMSAARIEQAFAEEDSDCGKVAKLKATITPTNGCSTVSQDITITGTFPSTQFDVVNNGHYTVSGNTVTRVVTAAQINTGITVELWLRPKYCTSVTSGTVVLTATAPSMMLSSQNLFCEPPLNGQITVPLNWTITPKPTCLSITKVALNPSVAPGENLQYRVTLTNTGTGPAQNVLIRDNFPGDLTPIMLPQGSSVTSNTATWTEALVPAGGSRQYNLTFSTPGICPATFVNCVEASACGNTVGPACATSTLNTGNMLVVQVSGNMFVSNGGTGLPVPPGLPSTGGIVPFVVEFAPFSTLSINETYIFPQGCIFRMREGAEIIVKADRQLTLDNNTRMASCDKMWKGIRVENNGALWMAKTYVSDAQYAVHIQQNATGLRLTENYFTDNQVGLYMPAGVSHKLDYHFIYFNTWQGTKPLKAAYAGMGSVHPLNAWSYAGMLMFNLSSGLTVGGNNNSFSGLFEGMVYGIRATNCSDITVYGNQFRNLNSSTYTKDPLTYGIFAVNGNALKPTIKVTGFGKTNPKLTFDNCQVGVYTVACHLDKVEQCNMGNMFIGVRAVDGRGCRLNIQQNKIAAQLYGILLQNSEFAQKIRIFDNVLDFPTATLWGQAGAALFNCSSDDKSEYHVEQNIVGARGAYYGGIYLSGCFSLKVVNNTVNLYQAKSETAGVKVEGGNNIFLIRNHCFGQDASMATEERASGIHTSMSPSIMWCCNDIHSTRNGVFVEGNCAGYFFGNEMDDHTYGLRFGPSGIMGGQRFDQGNMWSGSAGSIWQAWHPGGPIIAALSPFKVKQNSIYEPMPVNPVFIGFNTKWFSPPSEPNLDPFDCSQSLECEGGDAASLDPVVDGLVADGSFSIPYHTDGSIWTARRNLYARLSRYPVLVQPNSNMATFFAAQQNAEIGRLDSVARDAEALLLLNPSNSAAAANYYAIAQSLMAQMVAIDTQMVAASAAQQQVLLNQKAALQVQYAANRQSTEPFWENLRQQMLSVADQLLAKNAAIVTTTLQGANEKTWHGIYLSKLVRGDFDLSAQQVADLENVAYQCPLDGGGVVYAARGALEVVQDTVITWPNNCGENLQGGGSEDRDDMVTSVVPAAYKFFPNPVGDMLTVEVPASLAVERSLEIVNILGNKAIILNLSGKSGTSNISLLGLPVGVYWLAIREDGRLAFSGKVIKN